MSTSTSPKRACWSKLEELYTDSRYTDTFRSLYAAQTTYADIISQLELDQYGITTRHLTKLASKYPELSQGRPSAQRRKYTERDMNDFEEAVRSRKKYRDKRGRFQAADYAIDSGLNPRTVEGWYSRLPEASKRVNETREARSIESRVIHSQRDEQGLSPTESGHSTTGLTGYGTEEEGQANMTLEEMDNLMLAFGGDDDAQFGDIEYREEKAGSDEESTSYAVGEQPYHAAGTQPPHFALSEHEHGTPNEQLWPDTQ